MLSPARRSAKKSQRSGWTIADRQAVRPLPAWPSSRNVLRNHSAWLHAGLHAGLHTGSGIVDQTGGKSIGGPSGVQAAGPPAARLTSHRFLLGRCGSPQRMDRTRSRCTMSRAAMQVRTSARK